MMHAGVVLDDDDDDDDNKRLAEDLIFIVPITSDISLITSLYDMYFLFIT